MPGSASRAAAASEHIEILRRAHEKYQAHGEIGGSVKGVINGNVEGASKARPASARISGRLLARGSKGRRHRAGVVAVRWHGGMPRMRRDRPCGAWYKY